MNRELAKNVHLVYAFHPDQGQMTPDRQSTKTNLQPSIPMPYDPARPHDHSTIEADELRDQFHGVVDIIAALAATTITGIQIDAVNTTDPGQPAGVSVLILDNVAHLTFNIPRGTTGTAGTNGAPGSPGPTGPQGPPFANAIIGGVSTLNAGENAWVTVNFDGSNVQFFFGIPRGIDGAGGITPQQLDNAIAGTSRNSNNVPTLNQTADAEFIPIQMQAALNKIDELINALRR